MPEDAELTKQELLALSQKLADSINTETQAFTRNERLSEQHGVFGICWFFQSPNTEPITSSILCSLDNEGTVTVIEAGTPLALGLLVSNLPPKQRDEINSMVVKLTTDQIARASEQSDGNEG